QDEIIEPAAGAEPQLVHHLQVLQKPEGPRRRDLALVGLRSVQRELEALLAQGRRIAEQIGDREGLCGLDRQELLAAVDLIAAVDDDLLPRLGLLLEPDLL